MKTLHEWIAKGSISSETAEKSGFTELVRCKDCKYYDGNGTCMKIGIAFLTDYWFCADGERK